MPNPKKTESLLRQKWKKSKAKNIQRKRRHGVKIGQNCQMCIHGIPPTTNAKIKCNTKADVVFDHGKKYWKCYTYEYDRRLS